jgi:DnaJ-class molecular chaperone
MTAGKTLDIKVPAGSKDGAVLRLKGQGGPGRGGGPNGDALIEIRVEPHDIFSRRDNDVLVDLPITLAEALAGGKVPVPTVDGTVMLTIPPGANSGTVMRLKGRGIQGKGDQLVTLKVMLPDRANDELADFIKAWEARNPYEVRKK